MTTTDTTSGTLVPQRPHGRSLNDFGELKPAEILLLTQCRVGELAEVSDIRPEAATDDNTVRAGLLRFLLLGGDAHAPVHERGVRLHGAWVAGVLDLEHAVTISATVCVHCTFDEPLILRHCSVRGGVFLEGSVVPGIFGDGLISDGPVFLRCGFQSNGPVRLPRAHIRGDLDCKNAQFDGGGDIALGADGATIQGYVSMNHGFRSIGPVRFLGVQITGNLDCQGAQFDGRGEAAFDTQGATIQGSVFLRKGFQAIGLVRLTGAVISGDLDCTEARLDTHTKHSLIAINLRVADRFIFRKLELPAPRVAMSAASVGVLIDDIDAWCEGAVLDGFTYGSIGDHAPTSARTRLVWLDKQRPSQCGLASDGTDFCPQPWRQLQKVLREMGHTEDARQVAIAFEDRLRRADLIGMSPAHWWGWRKWLCRIFARALHYGFRILTGYGYRPMRLLVWMFCVWLVCAGLFWFSALPPNDVFAPSNPLVFQNDAYNVCAPGSEEAKAELSKLPNSNPKPIQGAGNWYLCASLREEYTGFSPLAYSLDVILPLVDLQQEKDWAPMIPTPKADPLDEFCERGIKHLTRLLIWAETLFGWLASLLLVAIVSGLTKRRED